MQKLDPNIDGKTMDIVADNIAKLKALFPEIVTEGKVDFEALKEVLGEYVEDREERYSFTWNGKSKARMLAQTPSNGTLRPCPEESVNFDTTRNLFIEGDNLEVLKLLQKSYYGKVKGIFIDPPYNTGGDFIYPDNFRDNIQNYLTLTGQVDSDGKMVSSNSETSGRYHTDWLNMMYPRLKLARNLLTDDGAIFITIDDTESPNLRKLCDEIFGEENFIASAVWQKAYVANMTAKFISNTHDYVLIYCKNVDRFSLGRFDRTEEQIAKFKNSDNDPRGPWKAENLSAGKFYAAGQFAIEVEGKEPILPPPGRYWRCNEETYKRWLEEGRIWFGTSGEGRPMLKKYLSEVQDGLTPETWWAHKAFGSNKEASIELKKLFDGAQTFDTPKPVKLLKEIIKLMNDPEAIVLDFFPGSATTAHSVLEQNDEDGGSRRFIMAQLPEPCDTKSSAFKAGYKFITDIGKERIRRVIEKIKSEQKTSKAEARGTLPGLTQEPPQLDLGFKVFKLDSTNIKPWDADFDDYESSMDKHIINIKPDRSEEDVLYEILLKYGLDLTLPIEERTIAGKKVFIVGLGALVLCLANGITLDVVEGIADLKDELKPEIMRVVFKDNGFIGPDGDVVKTNTIQILRQHGITDVKSL